MLVLTRQFWQFCGFMGSSAQPSTIPNICVIPLPGDWKLVGLFNGIVSTVAEFTHTHSSDYSDAIHAPWHSAGSPHAPVCFLVLHHTTFFITTWACYTTLPAVTNLPTCTSEFYFFASLLFFAAVGAHGCLPGGSLVERASMEDSARLGCCIVCSTFCWCTASFLLSFLPTPASWMWTHVICLRSHTFKTSLVPRPHGRREASLFSHVAWVRGYMKTSSTVDFPKFMQLLVARASTMWTNQSTELKKILQFDWMVWLLLLQSEVARTPKRKFLHIPWVGLHLWNYVCYVH